MSTPAFEAFLAKLYVEHDARERFLADPRGEAIRAGLSEEQAAALEGVDRSSLRLAAHSFERKRAKGGRARKQNWIQRLWNH